MQLSLTLTTKQYHAKHNQLRSCADADVSFWIYHTTG